MGQRHKATQHLNLELATLVDDKESFEDATPLLFGKTFDQGAKDHINTLQDLLKKPRLFLNVQKMQVMPYSWFFEVLKFLEFCGC